MSRLTATVVCLLALSAAFADGNPGLVGTWTCKDSGNSISLP
jgi:hypothetical protein